MTREISEKSKRIMDLLHTGLTWYEVHKKTGSPKMTCRYYYLKIYREDEFYKKIEKIRQLNLIRYKTLHKRKSVR